MRQAKSIAGFTLLETLVALAILAISLAAVLRAVGVATSHAEQMRIRVLADWVAQNHLALHSARGDWLPIGEQNGEDTQAGVRLLWKEKISPTPNPSFRRIEISVSDPTESNAHVLRRLSAYLIVVPRK
ncbi:MAG: type II secretion system minor pseudopilin GspI [Gallionellaceae bacterium]